MASVCMFQIWESGEAGKLFIDYLIFILISYICRYGSVQVIIYRKFFRLRFLGLLYQFFYCIQGQSIYLGLSSIQFFFLEMVLKLYFFFKFFLYGKIFSVQLNINYVRLFVILVIIVVKLRLFQFQFVIKFNNIVLMRSDTRYGQYTGIIYFWRSKRFS